MDGQEFLKTFDMQLDPKHGGIQSGGNADRQRDRLVREKWASLMAVGWEDVTVVNCLPWPAQLQTMYGYFTVHPPDQKKGELYHTYHIASPSIAIRDLGDAKFIPEVIMPVQIARDICGQYDETGGVFFFKGSAIPADMNKLIAQAHEKMTDYYKAKYAIAQSNWARTNKNPTFIDDRMRDAARHLYGKGMLDALPEWITVTRDEAVTSACPACGELVKKAAKVCRHCNYAIDADFAKANAHRFGVGNVPKAEPEPEPEPPTPTPRGRKGTLAPQGE